ncbi:Uncharacterised protein [Mycobacteroides abscessus]|nr:Uncharacterised protein [Mycobacteroides abscessus]
MRWTCSLPARPLPVTAALTSDGVCSATGTPRFAAPTIAMPAACAVPMTVPTLCCANTRSTATTSGTCSSNHASSRSAIRSSRRSTLSSGSVRITPTATSSARRPRAESTTPTPHRVSPGSTPRTRTPRPFHVNGTDRPCHAVRRRTSQRWGREVGSRSWRAWRERREARAPRMVDRAPTSRPRRDPTVRTRAPPDQSSFSSSAMTSSDASKLA